MKSSITFVVWFSIVFLAVSVLTSATASEPPRKPQPPADCSCGVCEDTR